MGSQNSGEGAFQQGEQVYFIGKRENAETSDDFQ